MLFFEVASQQNGDEMASQKRTAEAPGALNDQLTQ